jgi:hypothetical protein
MAPECQQEILKFSKYTDCLNNLVCPNSYFNYLENLGKREIKGKAIPLQPWTGPEGSKMLRLPDFKIIGT